MRLTPPGAERKVEREDKAVAPDNTRRLATIWPHCFVMALMMKVLVLEQHESFLLAIPALRVECNLRTPSSLAKE